MDDRELRAFIARNSAHRPTTLTIANAAGVSLATIKRRVTTDDVVAASRHFGVPVVHALLHDGVLIPSDIPQAGLDQYSDEALVDELSRRLALRHAVFALPSIITDGHELQALSQPNG